MIEVKHDVVERINCLEPDTSGLNSLNGCDLEGEEIIVLEM